MKRAPLDHLITLLRHRRIIESQWQARELRALRALLDMCKAHKDSLPSGLSPA